MPVAIYVHLCMYLLCVLSESCSREEFMCDRGRCLLPVSVCDGHPNCHDQTDEANCSHKHKGESMQTKTEACKGLRTQEWTYGRCFYSVFSQNVVDRKPGLMGPCQVQTTPGLILTSRYILNHVTLPDTLQTGYNRAVRLVFFTNLVFFCLPSVVHLVYICWGGSRHHAELQELQPGDSGCVWVWLCGGARQRRYWSWKSAGKVRPT